MSVETAGMQGGKVGANFTAGNGAEVGPAPFGANGTQSAAEAGNPPRQSMESFVASLRARRLDALNAPAPSPMSLFTEAVGQTRNAMHNKKIDAAAAVDEIFSRPELPLVGKLRGEVGRRAAGKIPRVGQTPSTEITDPNVYLAQVLDDVAREAQGSMNGSSSTEAASKAAKGVFDTKYSNSLRVVKMLIKAAAEAEPGSKPEDAVLDAVAAAQDNSRTFQKVFSKGFREEQRQEEGIPFDPLFELARERGQLSDQQIKDTILAKQGDVRSHEVAEDNDPYASAKREARAAADEREQMEIRPKGERLRVMSYKEAPLPEPLTESDMVEVVPPTIKDTAELVYYKPNDQPSEAEVKAVVDRTDIRGGVILAEVLSGGARAFEKSDRGEVIRVISLGTDREAVLFQRHEVLTPNGQSPAEQVHASTNAA